MTKIIFIGAIDFPFNSSNSNLIRRLFSSLPKDNYNIEILLVRGKIENDNSKNNRFNKYNEIKYQYCSFKRKPKYFILKLIEIIIGTLNSSLILIKRILTRNADIVFIYTGFPYINLPIVLISKLFNKKVIKISVDWYVKEQVVTKPYYIFKWLLFLFEIKILDKFLDGVIVLNKKLKEHYKRIKIKNILLVPTVIDLNEFNVIDSTVNEYITIGYCGAAPILNGVDVLINSFKLIHNEYPNTKLVIIGDTVGRDSELYKLKGIANKLNIQEQVEFTGRIPTLEVPKMLSKCDILVLPRKRSTFADHGFPTKLGEYFALKKLVILTKVGDFESYFKDGEEVIFCEPDDPISLSIALKKAICDKDNRKYIAMRGYNWALQNISSEIVSKKFIYFIENLK